jgi:hypothetical protein
MDDKQRQGARLDYGRQRACGRTKGVVRWRTMSHCGAWETTKDCGEREVEDKDILVIFKIYWMKKMTWMASRGKELHPNGIEGI